MSKIKTIQGREILDSRGNPTVEVGVVLENGVQAKAAVPSGASTGAFEAYELRDSENNKRYQGKGVLKAVQNVNTEIREALVGMEVGEQQKIDDRMRELDGTENKSRLGANAILGVSLAACRVSAYENNMPLFAYMYNTFFSDVENIEFPTPMFNILNGGKHADSGLCIQEYKIIPHGIKSYKEQLRAGSEIFHTLKEYLSKTGQKTSVGDEGGFAPSLESNTKALKVINKAIRKAGYVPGTEVFLGIDAAANSFYDADKGVYLLEPEGIIIKREDLIEIYKEWVHKYFLISIEDGLHEEDWEGWTLFHKEAKDFSKDILLIGDDLLVTNPERLQKALDEDACNSILIKPNQIGTVSETVETIRLARKNNMDTVISHRSGETVDTFIADLAVGSGSQFIKTGAPSRGERVCKYNRLLEIESSLLGN